MTKRGITAAELLAQLESDPEWVARRDQRNAEMARVTAQHHQAEAPLVEALREAGLEVESAWDLVNTATPYPAALPILLEHVGRPYPDAVRDGIARALAVGPDAKFGWDHLVELYRAEPAGTGAKDGLAVALSAIADSETVEEVVELVGDPVHGTSRIFFLQTLKRLRDPLARTALKDAASDPVLGLEARAQLKGRGV